MHQLFKTRVLTSERDRVLHADARLGFWPRFPNCACSKWKASGQSQLSRAASIFLFRHAFFFFLLFAIKVSRPTYMSLCVALFVRPPSFQSPKFLVCLLWNSRAFIISLQCWWFGCQWASFCPHWLVTSPRPTITGADVLLPWVEETRAIGWGATRSITTPHQRTTSSKRSMAHFYLGWKATLLSWGLQTCPAGGNYFVTPGGSRRNTSPCPTSLSGSSNGAKPSPDRSPTILPWRSFSPTYGPKRKEGASPVTRNAIKSIPAAQRPSISLSAPTCSSSGKICPSALPYNCKTSEGTTRTRDPSPVATCSVQTW